MIKALCVLLACALAPQAAMACQFPPRLSGMELQMLDWINAQRSANTRESLKKNASLDRAAQGHACDMAEKDYFAHQRQGGPNLRARLRAEGYKYRTAAENIAKLSSDDAALAAKLWRESPDHWANILNRRMTEIGLGIAFANGQYYWVMNVGRSQ